ncbi:U32 family peptidase [Solidesulfovibrio sp.]|uniref:peptidase U32 family protein n=1 Tax=Solidesulfovibrio sp. TaxID=2910990 RepID=UPI002605B69A|nr:U32 family peptidase [Solidesulfovibrio sp.]
MTEAKKPEILAPAGDPYSFLAALAAGADAVYCGLKHFSARMLARNFSVSELAALAELARARNVRTYVAVNTLLKPDEADKAGRLVKRLVADVGPDALIVQDIGVAAVARQAGFTGELHLSTLANVSSPTGLAMLPKLSFARAVLPRELSVDEMREMAEAAPEGFSLEAFVHGALCYNVSGRCYWSSYLGGKSGLRGRCVQPCRRLYDHRGTKGRYFSCQDLSLDVLTKALLTIPQVTAWKIEGRKKGPHYVYHVVAAYKLLRDAPDDASAKKMATSFLEQSLGRASTNYNFLPQRPKNPVDTKERTGSGMPAGKLTRGVKPGQWNLSARVALLPGDLVRLGAEDEPGHRIVKVTRSVPKGGRLTLTFSDGPRPESGMPAYLIDRREPGLMEKIRPLEEALARIPEREPKPVEFVPTLPKPRKAGRAEPANISVWRHPDMRKEKGPFGVWVSTKRAHNLPLQRAATVWWWLPPVIWPDEESEFVSLVSAIVSRGGKRFVLGAPWQTGLFPASAKGLAFWAGPFCNIANPIAVAELARLGFAGAFASPELSGEDLLALPGLSPLPLGIVHKGAWPLGLSRVLSGEVKTCLPVVSPKEEGLWAVKYDRTYWLYANWEMDLHKHRDALEKAGYAVFADLREPLPKDVARRERTSHFNWEVGLL